jgi:hypothetical protein
LHEFGELDEIDSMIENHEADVNTLNSHRADGRCDLSTEDDYSSKAPDPIHLWYTPLVFAEARTSSIFTVVCSIYLI